MDRLDLTHLAVRSFYGHDHPLGAPGLGPGVNVVYGPNGQGKTTLARAIHGALWPETVAPHRPTYEAAFRLGGEDWRVDLDAGAARYSRDGAEADRLPLPDASFRDRYALSLNDLLVADGRSFADLVRRDAAGGIDLAAARDRLGYQAAPSQRLKRTREAEDAGRAVQERRRLLDALRADEQTLDDVNALAARATEAAADAEVYRLVEDAHARSAEADAARRVVETFPAALARVAADTAPRYADVRAAVARATDKAEERAADLDAARDALAAHGWDAVTLPEAAELEARERDVQEAARTVASAEQSLGGAQERERKARALLGDAISPDADLDLDVLGDLSAFAQRAGRVAARTAELEERRMAAKARLNTIPFVEADEVARGADLLRTWLAYTVEAEGWTPSVPPRIAFVGASVLAVIAVAASVWWHPAGALLLLGALALAFVGRKAGQAAGPRADDPAARARDAFGALTVVAPAEWTAPVVKKTLDTMERRLLEQKARLMWAERVAEIERDQFRTEADQQAVDVEAASIHEAIGVKAPRDPQALYVLTQNLAGWQEAVRERAFAEGLLGKCRAAYAEAIDRMNAILDGVPVGRAADAATAAGIIAAAAREAAERDRLRLAVGHAETAAREAAEARTEAARALTAFLADLGVDAAASECEADEGVAALVEAHAPYVAAVAEADRARTLAEAADGRARAHARFAPALVEMGDADLAAHRADADARAARRDDWLDKASRIRERVEQARRDHSLETAQAEHTRALDALGDQYDLQADALVGHALAKHVDEQTRDEHLPLVFRRARALLADITADRFRLEFDAEGTSFTAVDTASGRTLSLDQLSSGTRLQLLLAVRLAFAETQEVGAKLPLLLDETLATSDDERAAAIAEAVLSLCRGGRQVFYFTAQDEEVATWRRLAAANPDVECRFVALGGAVQLARVDLGAVPAPATTRPVPEAAGHTLASYAEAAGVAPWSGWDPAEALHLWYLLDDPAEVEAALQAGYATWGQLRAALARDRAVPVAAAARVRRRAEAVAAWQSAWRQGRGRPVDRAVLEASGAVTEAFVNEVVALCGDCEGDANALLRCLRERAIGGFQARQVDKLEAFLLDEGYLSPDDPLSDDEVRRAVAASVPHADALADALAVLDRVRSRSEALAVAA